VVRHSSANHVEVTLQEEQKMLTLTVLDNGLGFKVDDAAKSEGLGMAGMRERASLAGGTLEIHSLPGQGTQVCCRLPIRGNNG
jgi:signal transduction histidine kinase